MKTAAVSRLIQSLTSNEDVQQDLWVSYLSTGGISEFNSVINKQKNTDTALDYCWQLCLQDPEDFDKDLLWL